MRLLQPTIIQAVLENDQTQLLVILEADKSRVNNEKMVHKRNKEGDTALFFAMQKGYLEMGKLLLKAKIYVNASNTYGYTALHWAARADQQAAVQFLIENKANVNATPCDLPSVGETQRMSPLFVAASRTQNLGGPATLVIKPLLDAKSDPNLRPSNDVAPIHFYLPFIKKFPDSIKLLLLARAKVKLELFPDTPLMPEQQKLYLAAKKGMCLFQHITLLTRYTSLISNIAQVVADYSINDTDIEKYQDNFCLFSC